MTHLRKPHLACALLAGLAAAPAAAQPALVAPSEAPPAEAAAASPQAAERQLDSLFSELAEPGREDWERIEGEINAIWSRSGSPSMDLLLRRGTEAIEAEDYPAAVEHLSALIDHAPDFAEGWNARATAFYLMGEYSLSISDVEHVLSLEPRHFGALTGLGFMLEQMNEPDMALRALEAVQELNPNSPSINDAVARLKRTSGDAEL